MKITRLSLGALALMLAACGGSSDSGGNSQPPPVGHRQRPPIDQVTAHPAVGGTQLEEHAPGVDPGRRRDGGGLDRPCPFDAPARPRSPAGPAGGSAQRPQPDRRQAQRRGDAEDVDQRAGELPQDNLEQGRRRDPGQLVGTEAGEPDTGLSPGEAGAGRGGSLRPGDRQRSQGSGRSPATSVRK